MKPSQPLLVELADFVISAPLTLSGKSHQMVRNCVIDAFGCILGGSQTPVAMAAGNAMRTLGMTRGMARIYGTAYTAPAHTAALLNAIAGHALEFDDWEIPGNTHPSVVLLPALLAILDEGTDGLELLSAYVAGFEVIARLGEALNFAHYDAGWHSTATLGSLGAAAAVARQRKLSPLQTGHALSIATSRATGLTCQFGTDSKALQAGFAAENGVVAATLAEGGLTGQLDILEHPRGMATLMAGVPQARMHSAWAKLGTPLAVEEYGILIKPWPSCGYTHRIMGCALELAAMDTDLHDIRSIELHLPDFHAAVLPYHQPDDRRKALFSLPFVAAMGLVYGDLTLTDLEHERWREPRIRRLIECASVHPFKPARPDMNYDPLEPDRMRITLTDGRCREAVCALPMGTPHTPLSDYAVLEKFRRNAGRHVDCDPDALLDWPFSQDVRTLFDRFGVAHERGLAT